MLGGLVGGGACVEPVGEDRGLFGHVRRVIAAIVIPRVVETDIGDRHAEALDHASVVEIVEIDGQPADVEGDPPTLSEQLGERVLIAADQLVVDRADELAQAPVELGEGGDQIAAAVVEVDAAQRAADVVIVVAGDDARCR